MKKLIFLMMSTLFSFLSADCYQKTYNANDSEMSSKRQEKHSSEVSQTNTVDNNDIMKGNKKAPGDKEIGKKIHELLKTEPFSKGFQNFAFNVTNGNVTLIGSVNSLENKNRMEESVKQMDGVKSVDNQLTIFSFERYPHTTSMQ